MVDIDLIVVNYRTYPLVQKFLDSYQSYKPKTDSQVLLIDNETTEKELDRLRLYDALAIGFADNLGYAKACNYGASITAGEFIAFFNSDTEFVNDTCVDLCVDFLDRNSEVGAVGPLQYSTSPTKVTHGGIVGTHEKPVHRGWHSQYIKNFRDTVETVDVIGSAYFTRRDVWEEMMACPIYRECFPDALGAFPPFPHFYEETLYSYHLSAHGYKCFFLGEAEMIHQWHRSSPVGSQQKNFKIGRDEFRVFCDKHGIQHS